MSVTYKKVQSDDFFCLVDAHFALLKIDETFPWKYAFF
jgi:hypothetical protein